VLQKVGVGKKGGGVQDWKDGVNRKQLAGGGASGILAEIGMSVKPGPSSEGRISSGLLRRGAPAQGKKACGEN